MSDSFVTPWTVACQAPLSMRFPGQEYWSGLPFPSPGDLPNPGIEPKSPALAGRLFATEPPEKSSRSTTVNQSTFRSESRDQHTDTGCKDITQRDEASKKNHLQKIRQGWLAKEELKDRLQGHQGTLPKCRIYLTKRN